MRDRAARRSKKRVSGKSTAGKRKKADKTKKSAKQRARSTVYDSEVKSIAFLIARKIGRYGTKPRHFYKQSWDKYRPQALKIIIAGARVKLKQLVNSTPSLRKELLRG